MLKCILTGATGLLGREVAAKLAQRFDLRPLGLTQSSGTVRKLDLRDPDALAAELSEARPDVVVHCAAYRTPDFCEEHPEETRRLNVGPVRVMCDVLPPTIPLLFISSDYVFDGLQPPYREKSGRSPVNVYGQSKVEAEDLVLARSAGIALRVPLLIGAGPTLSTSGYVAELRELVLRRETSEVDDVLIRFPTWTRDVAHVIDFILGAGAQGIFHYSGSRGGTRYAWALELGRLLDAETGHLSPSREAVPRPATRPPNAQLSSDRLPAMGYDVHTDFTDAARAILAACS